MKTIIAGLAGLCALAVGGAHATTFTFEVGGFSGGGTLSGTFEATDFDMNGQISSFSGEVTALSAALSGNAFVPDTTWGLIDLFGLVYDLDGDIGDGLDGDIEGMGLDNGLVGFFHGPGPIALCDGVAICGEIFDIAGFDGTTELIIIDGAMDPVPVPAAALLFAPAAAAFGFARKKKRA